MTRTALNLFTDAELQHELARRADARSRATLVSRSVIQVNAVEAKRIAVATGDAYSADCYGNDWTLCAQHLALRGLNPVEIEAVLRSKHMRWAFDARPVNRDFATARDLAAYLDDPKNKFTEAALADLVAQG